MRFLPTRFADAWLISLEPQGDERGSFARTFCVREFAEHGLSTRFVQHSVSHSKTAGTVRGMHFQRAPHQEEKIVCCLAGRLYDVIIDLRPASPTFKQWQGFVLTAATGDRLYIPKGFAHGFQALTENTATGYLISEYYSPADAAGVRHDDPAFDISWPMPPTVVSEKDRMWPDFEPECCPT